MKHSFKVHSTKDNQNNAIGVSYTVLSAPKDTEILLLEAGMNHASELSQISRAITPSIAAITNVGSAHIGNFGSVRNIAAAKLEITHGMTGGTLLLPFGDPYLHFLPSKTVSASDKRADICLIPKRTSHHETDYSFLSRGAFVTKFHSTITGAHIPPCLAFAVAVANESGIPAEVIAEAVSVLKCDDLSRSTVRHLGYIDVIDDSYNSSPEAVKTALKTLDLYEHKSKSVLLGDMLELGAMCEKLHFLVGCEAARHKINKLYAVGTYASHIANGALSQGFPKESIVVHKGYEEYGELAEKIKKNSVYGELLLVKGSHAVHLCELIKLL
jgi:UDP-N-acetylmuramoyl-tripeptide--D-alanyl-D-alanine ligase